MFMDEDSCLLDVLENLTEFLKENPAGSAPPVERVTHSFLD